MEEENKAYGIHERLVGGFNISYYYESNFFELYDLSSLCVYLFF
jgi:hypothetical protein